MIGPVKTHPDLAALYPDVAALGSLGAALRAMAEDGGRAVPVIASDAHPLSSAAVGSALSHRGRLTVHASATERAWSVRGEDQLRGLPLLTPRSRHYAYSSSISLA